jgi:5'-methylthioadenosine phosphorylase
VTQARADIGIIGGSGFYSLLDGAESVAVETPYGPPSEPPAVGILGGRQVAFITRHGATHRFAPQRVPYRANMWALRSLGVRQVVSLSAVGSLHADLGQGTVVSPDQVVDRTWGRASTYNDADNGVAQAVIRYTTLLAIQTISLWGLPAWRLSFVALPKHNPGCGRA